MADLGRAATGAAVDSAADDETAADAGADRHVEDRIAAAAGAEVGLGEAGDIGVVAEHGRQVDEIADPVGEREVVPAVDLMRLDDGSPLVVDGPAEADADAMQPVPGDVGERQQFGKGGFDLPANAVGAVGGNDGASPESRERAVARSDAELELGAADFDAEEHAVIVFGHRRRWPTRSEPTRGNGARFIWRSSTDDFVSVQPIASQSPHFVRRHRSRTARCTP